MEEFQNKCLVQISIEYPCFTGIRSIIVILPIRCSRDGGSSGEFLTFGSPPAAAILYYRVNCVPNTFQPVEILVLASTAGAGRMALPVSTRISARLNRVGNTVHP